EVKDTGNMAVVARRHGVKYKTVASWVSLERTIPAKTQKRELKNLASRLKDAELENRILKELLKKTNQLWLTGVPSVRSS
ncbi:MAG TPA: transposase, partial [Myxococcota bacterium]|nr:transposase [Myxococcota bacterium]